jgi:hypothetical protein
MAGGHPAENLREAHIDLANFEEAIDRTLAMANDIEDEYREASMNYHTSQQQARLRLTADEQVQVQTIFETSSVEQYHTNFAKLTTILKALLDLRNKHIRYSGTAEEIVHRVFEELDPAYVELNAQVQAFQLELVDQFAHACRIALISRGSYEWDEQGHRCAWHDASGPNPINNPVPFRMGSEWATYRAWVWSLPETQRAIEAGRSLDQVALNLLYKEAEGLNEEESEYIP